MALHRVESLVTGTVWKIERRPGDPVAEGDTLLIIESMKMEIPINATAAGVLQQVLAAEGEQVSEGQVLAVLVT